jgi:mRNA interferase MazF
VIVISNNEYNQRTGDIVVVAMTSNPVIAAYSSMIETADMVKGELNRPGKVRVDKVYTLSQSIVVKTFGRVKKDVLARVRREFQDLVADKET